MFFITKNCACISDSGKAEYRNKGRNHEGMFKFRLLDDDGEVYFYGYSSSCDDEATEETNEALVQWLRDNGRMED